MKIIENKRLIKGLWICGVLLLIAVSLFIYINNRENRIIRLGIFVGSPWDVPDAYSYEFIDEAIEKFEKNHPGVKVEYTSGVMKDEYSEWLSGKIIGGNAPDVFAILPEDFTMLQKTGSLQELDSLIYRDNSFDPKAYYSAAYAYGSANRTQYALPLECAPVMLFVNKTLLTRENILLPKTDWTWDDFYEICSKVTKDKDGNGVIDQFGVYNYGWEEAFLTNEISPFGQDGEACNLQNENAYEAVEFLQKMNDLTFGTVVTASDFNQGNVAFMPLTLAEYRTYKPYPWSMKRFSTYDWECITLPRGPHGENVSKMNTLLMGINSRSRKKQMSWELIKTFCYDEEIQNGIYKYRAGGSALKKILNEKQAMLIENQELSKDDSIDYGIINYIMEHSIAGYNSEKVTSVMDMFNQGIEDIVINKKNPEISIKQLQRQIN